MNLKKGESKVIKFILNFLDNAKEKIVNGECEEDELMDAIVSLNVRDYESYINPKHYCNADEAMRILGLKYNRSKFFKLTKEHGIKNYTVNNVHIGFKISEIKKLKEMIN